MPFEKGNTLSKGRPKKEKSFANMLRIAINEAHGDNGKTKLRAVAEKLVDQALDGEIAAIKEIADRLDGKVPQGVIGGAEDDPAIKFVGEIIRKIVHAKSDDRDGPGL